MFKLIIIGKYFSLEKYFETSINAWAYKDYLKKQGYEFTQYEIVKT